MKFLHWRQRRENELEEEIQSHLRLTEQDYVNTGKSPEQAKHAARREFGNVDMVKETTRQMWGRTWLERLAQDLQYALRQIRRSPGFTLAIVLTLALGIGANVAVFSVVNSVLLRPLPFLRSNELVRITWWSLSAYLPFIGPTAFREFPHRAQTLSDIAAYSLDDGNLNESEGAERIQYMRVSANFFSMLGVQPYRGRNFLAKEDQPGGDPVVIISPGLWKRHFGGDPAVIGKTLRLEGKTYSVIGILPSSFEFPDHYWLGKIEVWMPLVANAQNYDTRMRWMYLIGRRKPSIGIQAVHDELTGIWKQVKPSYQSPQLQVMDWQEELVGRSRKPLLVFLGAFSFVLLIACVNVANLWLSRIISREKEIVVRLAIGAKRIRIFRQLLTESLLVTLLGGAFGLALAFGIKNTIQHIFTESIVRVPDIHMDFRVVVFTLLLCLFTSAVVVIAAASQTSRFSLTESLKEGRNRAMGHSIYRMRRVLVVFQVALVVTLLIGSGLLLRTLLHFQSINPGYQPAKVLSMEIKLLPAKYPTPQARSQLLESFMEKLKFVPGIKAAALTRGFPIFYPNRIYKLQIEGTDLGIQDINEKNMTNPAVRYEPDQVSISGDYFLILGIPFIKGRAFTDREGKSDSRPAVVNEEFVRRYIPSREPIGLQIRFNNEKAPSIIVGVVRNIHDYLTEQNIHPLVYTHHLQEYFEPPWPGYVPPAQTMGLAIKYDRNPAELANAVRRVLHQLDPDQAITEITTLEEKLSNQYSEQNAAFVLIGASSVLALVLAFIGIYGVVSYLVTQRIQEIGIRRALGAGPGKIIRLILAQSALSSVVGLLLGLAAAFALTRYIAHMLYGVTPRDPVVFISISVVAITVSIIAGYIPSRRATRIELSTALREE